MTAIDCSDCYLAIEIGDGVKRALVHHFARFVGERLAARGLAAGDDGARDRVEREVWRLAARVLAEVEAELPAALDETLLMRDPQRSAQDILTDVVAATAAEIEERYLVDDLLGFEALAAKLARALS